VAGKEVAAYHYVNQDGFPLFDVVRYEPKRFVQRHRENGSWVYNLNGVQRVPYRLPAVLEAVAARRPVWICEGEEDVHALERLGVAATTNPGGTGNTKLWTDFAHWLEGAEVVIVADRDEPGMRHARQVRDALAGVALTVCIVRAAEGKDASDHVGAGFGLEDFVEVEAEQPVDAGADRFAVTWSDSKPPKLILPPLPGPTDTPGLCGWLTAVLCLDPLHPIVGGSHYGKPGYGHIKLLRSDAPELLFQPASMLNTGSKLTEALMWQQSMPGDREPHGFTNEHARHIAYVAKRLCGARRGPTAEEETTAIVGAFMEVAAAVEGHTLHGTTAQRYEALDALRRPLDGQRGVPLGPPRYLVDSETGEVVIRVGELRAVARTHLGTALAHGWLDARMDALGWDRVTLNAWAMPGREGRSGSHHRLVEAYRGHLPAEQVNNEIQGEIAG